MARKRGVLSGESLGPDAVLSEERDGFQGRSTARLSSFSFAAPLSRSTAFAHVDPSASRSAASRSRGPPSSR